MTPILMHGAPPLLVRPIYKTNLSPYLPFFFNFLPFYKPLNWKKLRKIWSGSDPPPVWELFPHNPVFLSENVPKSHNFGDFFVRPTFCTGSIEALAEAWWNKGGDSLLTRLHQIRPITRDQMKNIPSETSPITKDPPLTQLYTYYVALLKIPNSELLTGNTPWTTNGFPLWDLAS